MVFELCKYVFFVVVVFVFLINYSLAAIFNHGYFSVGQWNTNDLGVEKNVMTVKIWFPTKLHKVNVIIVTQGFETLIQLPGTQ